LLARLAPKGVISLHFTLYRDAHLQPPPVPPKSFRPWRRAARPAEHPPGAMMMYDYDMGAILAVLHRYGVGETALAHTDHGGHHGELIFGRRD